MTRITVVDDSHVDRMLIAGLLKTHPEFEVAVADDAKSALRRFADARPDLVVSDLIMPEMDGFEFVKQMRALFPTIPVILMTAYGNESIAVQALEAGAASYVPKARQAECLVDTVRRVMARAAAELHRDAVSDCMDELQCKLTLDNNPALIRPLVDELQHRVAAICIADPTERLRTMIALEEALLTAMYEGNLEITEAELVDVRNDPASGRLATIVEEKCGRPELSARKTRLEVRLTKEGAYFKVRNDGLGLERPSPMKLCSNECFESGEGRGPMLMRSLMDRVLYNEFGNEVTLVKQAT